MKIGAGFSQVGSLRAQNMLYDERSAAFEPILMIFFRQPVDHSSSFGEWKQTRKKRKQFLMCAKRLKKCEQVNIVLPIKFVFWLYYGDVKIRDTYVFKHTLGGQPC